MSGALASRDGQDAPERVLAFEAAGRALALPAGAVERVLEPPPVQRVPGAPGWFAGLVVTGGRLLPVTDLGAWLEASGGDADSGARGRADLVEGAPEARLVELDASLGLAALLVERVEGLVDFREANADDLADGDPVARLGARRPRARAIRAEGEVRALLDPVALLASPAFADLGATA